MVEKKKRPANCYFCGKPVDEGDYCYGCKEYVCQDCDQTQVSGNHKVNDHRSANMIGEEE